MAIVAFSSEGIALNIADNYKPLCLCGDTYIQGNCLIPKAGVKPASMRGRYYLRKELIYGEIKAEDHSVPNINPLFKRFSPDFLLSFYGDREYTAELSGSMFSDTLIHSFFKPTVVLIAENGITLKDCTLHGNIILVSDSTVEIDHSADLEDIIICARNIRIRDNFTGSAQFIATDSISCHQNSFLTYPSVMAVIHLKKQQIAPFLLLSSGSRICGTVLCYSDKKIKALTVIGEIEKNATVIGTLYANNEICLKGKVHGSVLSTGFILRTPVSIYENYLVDVEIDYSKLPKEYIGVSYSENKIIRKVIKWLQ